MKALELEVKEKEILSLKDELVALKVLIAEKQGKIDFLWSEVEDLETELHPGGYWEWKEEEEEEGEGQSAEEGKGPLLPLLQEEVVSGEKKEGGMDVDVDGTEPLVEEELEVVPEVTTKEEQIEKPMRWRWNLVLRYSLPFA